MVDQEPAVISNVGNAAAEARHEQGRALPDIARDLTIVIPAYRCARYLPAAIESALHCRPAMILVASDGGGLDVPRIAQSYERNHPARLRVLYRRRRRGAALNVNLAVHCVTTPYFAKLDGDDILTPRHLEAAMQIISQRPSLAIVAGHERRIEANDWLNFQPDSFAPYQPDPSPTILSGIDAFRFILAWNPNPCSSGCIYRTEAFRQIGGFDPSMPWGEDWEIWFRFPLCVAVVDCGWMRYNAEGA
jgi:glycosyltransferase involved in cell wall biosynthesis